MNALLDVLSGDPWRASLKPLALAVVDEDSHTHAEAEAACDVLLRALGEEAVLKATWWRTSVLHDPKLAHVAALSIAASDIILVFVHSHSPPSADVRSWIENWPLAGNQPRLLALLGDRDMEGSEWDTLLAEVARLRQIMYVAGHRRYHGSGTAMASRQQVMPSRFIEPYQHWGLNE